MNKKRKSTASDRESHRKWKAKNPEVYRQCKARARAKERLQGKKYKRDKEQCKRTLAAWRLANPEKVRKHRRDHNRKRRNGTTGIFSCSTKGCPYRVKTRLSKCLKCLAELAYPPAMTMHDRAIGISDFYRTDGSLPPLHTVKSRAKKGVQWTQ